MHRPLRRGHADGAVHHNGRPRAPRLPVRTFGSDQIRRRISHGLAFPWPHSLNDLPGQALMSACQTHSDINGALCNEKELVMFQNCIQTRSAHVPRWKCGLEAVTCERGRQTLFCQNRIQNQGAHISYGPIGTEWLAETRVDNLLKKEGLPLVEQQKTLYIDTHIYIYMFINIFTYTISSYPHRRASSYIHAYWCQLGSIAIV